MDDTNANDSAAKIAALQKALEAEAALGLARALDLAAWKGVVKTICRALGVPGPAHMLRPTALEILRAIEELTVAANTAHARAAAAERRLAVVMQLPAESAELTLTRALGEDGDHAPAHP